MPEPEKAMQEIRRVLKKDGILYAPTFLWAEKKSSGLRKRLMSITGFKAYKEWNKENFCEFITDYGFTVVKVNLVDGGLAPDIQYQISVGIGFPIFIYDLKIFIFL